MLGCLLLQGVPPTLTASLCVLHVTHEIILPPAGILVREKAFHKSQLETQLRRLSSAVRQSGGDSTTVQQCFDQCAVFVATLQAASQVEQRTAETQVRWPTSSSHQEACACSLSQPQLLTTACKRFCARLLCTSSSRLCPHSERQLWLYVCVHSSMFASVVGSVCPLTKSTCGPHKTGEQADGHAHRPVTRSACWAAAQACLLPSNSESCCGGL